MFDQRGIKRSFCTQCTGEEKCEQFESSEVTPFCGYCGCPPIKHKRVDILAEVQHNNVDVPKNSALSPEVSPSPVSEEMCIENDTHRNEIISVGELNSIKNENLNPLIPELPKFSNCIETALISGTIIGSLWSNMIMQCATYFANFEQMKTKSSYEQVGRKMFDKYPCIEGPGPKPWSHFTKCLSQKIRTERMKIKSIRTSIVKKDFSSIASGTKMTLAPKKQTSDEKRTFFRSEAKVTSNISETEISEAKVKIAHEWEREVSDKSLIKSLLRDTFNDRTAMLKEGVSFKTFLKNYPCFMEDLYVIYEFSMLLGRNEMQKLCENMKEFFRKIRDCNQTGSTEGDFQLSDWIWFEKKCGIFQTKGEKSSPIIEVVKDPAEYREKLLKARNFPAALLLLEGMEIKDCAVVYAGDVVKCTQKSVINLLTILLGLYYILEINYPKCFLQAMGALASYVLSHNYYKLGNRALQTLRIVNSHQ